MTGSLWEEIRGQMNALNCRLCLGMATNFIIYSMKGGGLCVNFVRWRFFETCQGILGGVVLSVNKSHFGSFLILTNYSLQWLSPQIQITQVSFVVVAVTLASDAGWGGWWSTAEVSCIPKWCGNHFLTAISTEFHLSWHSPFHMLYHLLIRHPCMQQVLLVFLFNMENCFNTVKIYVNPVTTNNVVWCYFNFASFTTWQAVAFIRIWLSFYRE